MSRRVDAALACGIIAAALGAGGPAWAQQVTQRVSVGPGGRQSNDASFNPAISADGRFVAFQTFASNLVPGDTNGNVDVFVHDRRTGVTSRVSLGPNGRQGDNSSLIAALSANGRFVAFESDASNLVPGDTNGAADIFIRDRRRGTTERASLGPGRRQGNRGGYSAALSADGRLVAFTSAASNLVPGDTNNAIDVFVRDRVGATTERVSIGPGGRQGNDGGGNPTLSAGGRFVAFESAASNLVAGDTNADFDIFVHDRRTGRTSRASLASGGGQANAGSGHAALSLEARFVAFDSEASNLVPGDTNGAADIFVHDRRTRRTERVSLGPWGRQGNGGSYFPRLSATGRFVAFSSRASNLVAGDTNAADDVFVHDRRTGTTRRVSRSTDGRQGNGFSGDAALSADGRVIAFGSEASKLVRGDTNGQEDVFVRALTIGR